MIQGLLLAQASATRVDLNEPIMALYFLDEIANTSGLIQEKLLRVVEYGEFERVGGSRTINHRCTFSCRNQ